VGGVLGLLMRRNGKKRDKKIEENKNNDRFFSPQLFWRKVFDMDFPQKVFDSGIFELPLLRNAQKVHFFF
jgi:hypothetical protein